MVKVNPLLAGITCRCPNCARGKLFNGYLQVIDRCRSCDFDLSEAGAGDAPVTAILLIVGCVCMLGVILSVLYGMPTWLIAAIWLPLSTILSAASLPPFKGAMVALQCHFDAGEAIGKVASEETAGTEHSDKT